MYLCCKRRKENPRLMLVCSFLHCSTAPIVELHSTIPGGRRNVIRKFSFCAVGLWSRRPTLSNFFHLLLTNPYSEFALTLKHHLHWKRSIGNVRIRCSILIILAKSGTKKKKRSQKKLRRSASTKINLLWASISINQHTSASNSTNQHQSASNSISQH